MGNEALIERFERLADKMEQFLGPPEIAPGPDAYDIRDAAAALKAAEAKHKLDHDVIEQLSRAALQHCTQKDAAEADLAAARAEIERLMEDTKCVVVTLKIVAEFLAGSNPLHMSGGHRNTDLRGEVAAAIALSDQAGKAT